MPENLTIQLTPYFNDISEELGYDIESGDINERHVLHEQGYRTKFLSVEPGAQFKIDRELYEATLITNDVIFKPTSKLEFQDFTENFQLYEDIIELDSGEYLFHEDGVTIELLNYLPDEFDFDYSEDDENDEEEIEDDDDN